MIGELESAAGTASSMRKTVKVARDVGTFMILYGCALTGGMFFLNSRFELLTFVTVLVATGSSMITGVSFAKAMQAKAESTQCNVEAGGSNGEGR